MFFAPKSFTLRSISFNNMLRNTHTTSAKDEHKTAANDEAKQPQIRLKLGTNAHQNSGQTQSKLAIYLGDSRLGKQHRTLEKP